MQKDKTKHFQFPCPGDYKQNSNNNKPTLKKPGMCVCLGLINWDWITYRGLVLEKTESPSLSNC